MGIDGYARPYCDSTDLLRMRELLVEGTRAGIAASYMHPGMLDWATHCPPDEDANRHNICLWERAGDGPPFLLAWAFYLAHEETFDLYVEHTVHGTAQHERIVAEYVAWADARAEAAGLQQIQTFWVMDYDSVLGRLLEAHGFAVQEGLQPPLFERTLDELPVFPLPSGYSVQGVQTMDDGRLRAAVTHAAFRLQEEWADYWADYVQFIGSAVYDGACDLFVRAPDGRGASACTIWFDPVNGTGLFEPVATHPDFQGKGLAKAVMAEGMRRMRAAGMQRAVLGFDPNNAPARALYTSLGFRTACFFAMYSKKR